MLEPEVENMVQEKVRSGAYRSADELLNQAVRQFLGSARPRIDPTYRKADPWAIELMQDFPLNMEWLRQHRNEYRGEWVALHKGRLIAHSKDGAELDKAIDAQGIEVPFMERIPEEDHEHFWGGWL